MLDLKLVKEVAKNANTFVVAVNDGNEEVLVLPLDDLLLVENPRSIAIFGDILYQEDDFYHFANGRQIKKIPELYVKPRESKFPLTVKRNEEFFFSEDYLSLVSGSTLLQDTSKDPMNFLQCLSVFVDPKTGGIMKTNPRREKEAYLIFLDQDNHRQFPQEDSNGLNKAIDLIMEFDPGTRSAYIRKVFPLENLSEKAKITLIDPCTT